MVWSNLDSERSFIGRTQRFEISTGDSDTPVRAVELANFLAGLSVVNYLAVRFITKNGYAKKDDIGIFDNNIDRILEEFKTFLRNEGYPQLNYKYRFPIYTAFPPSEHDIVFSEITTNSPITFKGFCTGLCMMALVLSICFAGGEGNLKDGSFKVNSVAGAVKELYLMEGSRPDNK